MPFVRGGMFYGSLYKVMKETYNIDITSENMDIIMSRITWVQRHEDRRTFVHQ